MPRIRRGREHLRVFPGEKLRAAQRRIEQLVKERDDLDAHAQLLEGRVRAAEVALAEEYDWMLIDRSKPLVGQKGFYSFFSMETADLGYHEAVPTELAIYIAEEPDFTAPPCYKAHRLELRV